MRPILPGLLGAALAAYLAGVLAGDGWLRLALTLMALILFGVALLQETATLLRRRLTRARLRSATEAAEDDPVPGIVTGPDGTVLARNRAARRELPDVGTIAALLRPIMADPVGCVARLRARAGRRGTASEEGAGRGGRWRLSVQAVGPELELWRLDRPGPGTEDPLPRILVGPDNAILRANDAFRDLAGEPPGFLDDLILDPPFQPGRVHRLRGPGGPIERLVAPIAARDGQRELCLLPWGGPAASDWDSIEELPVPLLRIAPSGLVLAANRHARALLPMPVEEGVRLSDLLEGLGRPLIDWIAEVAAGRPAGGPQFLRGTGAHHDTILRVSLSLAGPPGDPRLIAVLDDVTELKAIEAQFVQSQKMQALGQLAGGVAHDFNNLLTAISGHCDLLLLRHDQDDPDYADLIQIRQNVNRAASLVGQLLAFSRKQSLMPERIDLRLALSDLTHLLNRLVGEKVHLVLEHDPDLDCIRADRRQFEQVMMNLVVNARDAMPEGGEIRIETGNLDLAEPLTLDRATIPPGRYVLVKVVDQGTGIPPERLPKIFEPFYTTKRPGEGTGLGLSTAYGIVKQSGGYIFADSEVGRGTTFTLWFPAHGRPEPARAAPPARPAVEARAEGTVLLVEDEAPVRAFAARALRMRGFDVIEADCAEAALEALADPEAEVDLILSDVILPDVDGPTWVRKALEDHPGLRVVFVSGYAEESFSEQKALIPGSVFLPKPFSLVDLTATVERCLASDLPQAGEGGS